LKDKLAKGLLTEKEKVKYNADAIAFEKSIIVEEKKLKDLFQEHALEREFL
jgi:hypothetical protein|tara:strand:+ start:280 stop:432 length:153 start_codon:yes stop_codon:yes gene_type:complete